MQITRRQFLATATASALLPRALWANTSLTLGGLQIDTLSDGHLMLPGDFILGGMPPVEAADIIARYGLDTQSLTPPCNVTLARIGDRRVLFDVGAGPDFQPTAGKLMDALDALQTSPDEITDVIFTHAHPDHLWGLLDEFDEPVFANATHRIGQTEFDYWTDPNTVSTIGDARTTFAVGAARRLEAIKDQLVFFKDGDEVLSGISARATLGHTPGHMAFELREGTQSLMVVGDAIGNHHVAFERPEWASGSDQDGETAAKTRVSLLDQLATDQTLLIGFHLSDGGIGRAERKDGGYRFTSEI